jgi:hypothetical protein
MDTDLLPTCWLTTGAVWLVLELAQRCGERMAGLTAGLPITELPRLTLLGRHHAYAFVPDAALGGLLTVAGSAVFTLAVLACGCAAVRGRCAQPVLLARRSEQTPRCLLVLQVGAVSLTACFLSSATSAAACGLLVGWAPALCLGLVGAFGWGVFTRDQVDVPNRPERITRWQGLLAVE